MNNIRTRNLLIKIFIIVVVCLTLMVCGNIYISKRIAADRKVEVEKLVGYFRVNYPEISESELMDVLKGRSGDAELGGELLKKYGYDEEYYKINLGDERTRLYVWNSAILLVLAVSLLIVFVLYQHRQTSKINEIADYLSQLNKRNYDLKTNDNDEDDLTLLRNEIFRTTMLLRETSEYETKLNADLSRSMEDISHQLRTPLASMTIMLDNIYDDPDMPADMRQDFIRSISMQINWMSSLVNSMLKLAKFDAGTIKMADGEVDVEKMIADALDKLSVIIELRNVEVVNEVHQDDADGNSGKVTFIGDYNWQLEAVTNIIKNAVEHSHEEGRVWVSASKNDVYTEIVIRDEGEGMSEDDRKHIFERFYRAQNAGTESIGIGLSLAKCIVEANNGYITVESELNKGTEFKIRYVRKQS
ncbi:MAG: HAMP domain-containing histidine kinase [Lachnospiraceae bacterium]|nr:HAMP domain-containing histidine kinase [Lachnospiraceae bacterium]